MEVPSYLLSLLSVTVAHSVFASERRQVGVALQHGDHVVTVVTQTTETFSPYICQQQIEKSGDYGDYMTTFFHRLSTGW